MYCYCINRNDVLNYTVKTKIQIIEHKEKFVVSATYCTELRTFRATVGAQYRIKTLEQQHEQRRKK